MKRLSKKTLLLAGAGHAHIGLLRRLSADRSKNNALNALIDTDIHLISEQPHTLYSGMLPGWMAGHYQLDDISIDTKSLCLQAGVRFIQQSITKITAASNTVDISGNERFEYDVLSLNTGADTDLRGLSQADDYKSNDNRDDMSNDLRNKVITIRPLSRFTIQWQQILDDARQSDQYRLAIVGAGAAATELVMAAQVALQQINGNHQVTLICGENLLSGFVPSFRQRVIKQLHRHGITMIEARATAYRDGQLSISNASFPVDAVIAATGVRGASWTASTDLETVDNGFVAVNSQQQSVSHPNVFAVGDVATRVDQYVAHSGVHAVHGGAIEAGNLLAYLQDEVLTEYQPRTRTLYLLSCGDKYAIGSWGYVSLQGRWVWYLKRQIDKRFVTSCAA